MCATKEAACDHVYFRGPAARGQDYDLSVVVLEKHRAQLETGQHFGHKREYFQRNLKQILELVAAGVPQEEILAAFEQDGMKMSSR